MNVYLLGLSVSDVSLAGLISKWNIIKIQDEGRLKATLDQIGDSVPHFILEVFEINEKKFNELKALGAKYGKKIKFIVFYQTLKASPVINKLHGADILLIGPEERALAELLIKRFFNSLSPLFRRWGRFQLVTSGTLSLLSSQESGHRVTVVNFGPHGAKVEWKGEVLAAEFKKKDFVVLEYLSNDGKKIRMQSRVCWSQRLDGRTEAGIQFISREL